MSGGDLVWEEPPRPRRLRADHHSAIAAQLRERPGEWARIYTMSRSSAYSAGQKIKIGAIKAYRPAQTFEVVVRAIPDTAQAAVYARYIGNGDAPVS